MSKKPAPTIGPDGDVLSEDAMPYLTSSPLLEKRRISFGGAELIELVGSALVKRGVDPQQLQGSRWVWAGRQPDGAPRLYIIFPGPQA